MKLGAPRSTLISLKLQMKHLAESEGHENSSLEYQTTNDDTSV